MRHTREAVTQSEYRELETRARADFEPTAFR